jgi:hypothetical protein
MSFILSTLPSVVSLTRQSEHHYPEWWRWALWLAAGVLSKTIPSHIEVRGERRVSTETI